MYTGRFRTLGGVAQHIHISPCYLSNLFSRIAGCRFVGYPTRLRLRHGVELHTGLPPRLRGCPLAVAQRG